MEVLKVSWGADGFLESIKIFLRVLKSFFVLNSFSGSLKNFFAEFFF